MKVLVTGASGYIGARAIPVLLKAGYTVRAAFTKPERSSEFWWAQKDGVDIVGMDVFDPRQVADAVDGVSGVLYLIHSMDGDDFSEKDRQAATTMAQACATAQVDKIVYVSGIVPQVDESELSEHITSRLEVERLLTASGVPTVSLRAAVIMGYGSTSFEIIRQISERMPVHTIPTWMESRVQPVAVTDMCAAIVGAFADSGPSRHVDIAGPTALPYSELLERYCQIAGITRPQMELPGVSSDVVGVLAGAITDVDSATVEALIESLHHDMVASGEQARSLLPSDHLMVDLDSSIRRALREPNEAVPPRERDPLARMPFDPQWAGGSGGGLGAAGAALSAVASALKDRLAP